MIEILINGEEIYAIINGERTSIDNDIIKFNINDEIKDFITELTSRSDLNCWLHIAMINSQKKKNYRHRRWDKIKEERFI